MVQARKDFAPPCRPPFYQPRHSAEPARTSSTQVQQSQCPISAQGGLVFLAVTATPFHRTENPQACLVASTPKLIRSAASCLSTCSQSHMGPTTHHRICHPGNCCQEMTVGNAAMAVNSSAPDFQRTAGCRVCPQELWCPLRSYRPQCQGHRILAVAHPSTTQRGLQGKAFQASIAAGVKKKHRQLQQTSAQHSSVPLTILAQTKK
mmetsp:Transcript_138438/g.275969  ORF Transcript_138438/g.275969 Transcript_138438/m.275969 type:complete len:206 (-) Transcript_138438:61-678(-)